MCRLNFFRKKEEQKEYYEIYFCDTSDAKTMFGKYTDYFNIKITTLEQAQQIISSKVNGWGYCSTKINDYTYFNYKENTYFIIVKE